MSLENKVAVIVGAGSGMGRCAAIRFAQEGARVVVGDYNEEAAEKVAAEVRAEGNEASACFVDATRGADVKAVMDFAIETYGKIDIVFCTAGKAQTPSMIWELDDEEFDRQIAINSKSWRQRHAAISSIRAPQQHRCWRPLPETRTASRWRHRLREERCLDIWWTQWMWQTWRFSLRPTSPEA